MVRQHPNYHAAGFSLPKRTRGYRERLTFYLRRAVFGVLCISIRSARQSRDGQLASRYFSTVQVRRRDPPALFSKSYDVLGADMQGSMERIALSRLSALSLGYDKTIHSYYVPSQITSCDHSQPFYLIHRRDLQTSEPAAR